MAPATSVPEFVTQPSIKFTPDDGMVAVTERLVQVVVLGKVAVPLVILIVDPPLEAANPFIDANQLAVLVLFLM
jgi:hypothetical protein